MEFLSEYGLFFAKAITVVISIIFVLGAVTAQAVKGKGVAHDKGHIEVRKINDVFDDYEETLQDNILIESDKKDAHKKRKKERKVSKKSKAQDKNNLYVIHFEGDVKASAVENLRQEINAILTVATDKDEVLINLESPGGMVHTYGLAASQLHRLRTANIPLTVAVDKVAASGGYLMACVANKIISAPFAIIGSIGVLAQIPNFNRALKKVNVDYEVMTAGEYKAPITMFGEITEKGKNKLKEELEKTHELFKNYITDNRPQVPIAEVATGEVWYGQQAIDHQLVDQILTYDDYLMSQRKEKNIFLISYTEKKSIQEKLGFAVQQGISNGFMSLFDKEQQVRVTKEIS